MCLPQAQQAALVYVSFDPLDVGTQATVKLVCLPGEWGTRAWGPGLPYSDTELSRVPRVSEQGLRVLVEPRAARVTDS